MAVLARRCEESKPSPFVCNLFDLANDAAPFQDAAVRKIEPEMNVIYVTGSTTNVAAQPKQAPFLNELVICASDADQPIVFAYAHPGAPSARRFDYLLDAGIKLIVDECSLSGNAPVGIQLLEWPKATAMRSPSPTGYMPTLGRVEQPVPGIAAVQVLDEMVQNLSQLRSAAALVIPGLREMTATEQTNLRQYYKKRFRKV